MLQHLFNFILLHMKPQLKGQQNFRSASTEWSKKADTQGPPRVSHCPLFWTTLYNRVLPAVQDIRVAANDRIARYIINLGGRHN